MEKYHLQKLGKRIRQLRQNRGLTQVDLAVQAGVTRLRIIAIEAGSESVAIGSHAKVLAALGWELSVSALTRPVFEELAEVFNGS